jgi:hypothetical protein
MGLASPPLLLLNASVLKEVWVRDHRQLIRGPNDDQKLQTIAFGVETKVVGH